VNTILLFIGSRPWTAVSSRSLLTRAFGAIALFSVEMQIVSWLGVGSIRSLVVANTVVAIAALALRRPMDGFTDGHSVPFWRAVPWPAAVIVGSLVLGLNLGRGLEAADPYHLDIVQRIEQSGRLAYDAALDPKINVVSWLYELLLADLKQVPVIGDVLLRLHGVFGLLLYLVGVAAARELLGASSRWWWSLMLVVPVVFHQLVLVKNDLFAAVPAFVAVVWVVTRARSAPLWEVVWAAWVTGLVVAVKLTSFPLALILVGALAIERGSGRWSAIGAAVLGGLLGAVTGGLVFSLIENLRVYGAVLPIEGIGDRNEGVLAVLVSIGRFAVSLVDQGLVTRRLWPGRGGWGGTFGLPFMWAVVMLIMAARRSPQARRGLLYAAVQFAAFAAIFPDADLAHRLVLAPGLLVVAVALGSLSDRRHGWLDWSLVGVTLLSGAQLVRSAWLYSLV
jgi:hypothetical protein